jgi:hypothetical protein
MPNWKPETPRTEAVAADLLARYQEHYEAGTLQRGPRGIFYDLRPHGRGNGMTYYKDDSAHPKASFGPMEAHPEIVQEVLQKMRRADMIPESWVADGRAVPPIGEVYDESADESVDSTVAYVRAVERNFKLDPQRDQPVWIEVLCEAEDLAPRLARIANPYGVEVYIGKGQSGMKGNRKMGERAAERDVPTVVLHISDRDRSGDVIYVSVAEDIVAWADGGEVGDKHTAVTAEMLADALPDMLDRPGELFAYRLALTPDHADELDVLDADGKAEADAVPVPVMDKWLTDAIEALQDPARRDELKADENAEREGILGRILDRLIERPEGGG